MKDAHGSRPRLTASRLIATVLVVAALHWMQVLAAPIAFALFLIALVWPVQDKLEAHIPRWLALLISVLLLLLAATALLLVMGYGIGAILEGLAPYAPRMQDAYGNFGSWLEWQGVEPWSAFADQLGPGWVFGILQGAAARFNTVAGFLALTVIFLILGLSEISDVRRRLPGAFGEDAAELLVKSFQEIAWKFRRYMLVRTLVSIFTGMLTWLFALTVGLDLAAVWGGLAFALNFIPFVGSIAAVFPPVLFAFVQFESWQTPLLVLAGMGLIQFSIGNFLDPRLEGRALAISPFAVVVSIFFWGLIWGIPGAFIGVPVTIALAAVCNQFHTTCWISRLLIPLPRPMDVPAREDE